MQLWLFPGETANRVLRFSLFFLFLTTQYNSIFLSVTLFVLFFFKENIFKLFFSLLYERTSCLCLKYLVLASTITLIRGLLSLREKTLQFIYFYFKHIIDCCLSSHPHLRESIYLNLMLLSSAIFKYKWSRDRLVTRWFLYVFPPICEKTWNE